MRFARRARRAPATRGIGRKFSAVLAYAGRVKRFV
jgi:hypothetical protein